MKKVFKYATGQEIPEGAKYLCTKVEKVTEEYSINDFGGKKYIEHNVLVWHYFLIEIEE